MVAWHQCPFSSYLILRFSTDHPAAEQTREAQSSMASDPAPMAVRSQVSLSSAVVAEGQPSNTNLQAQMAMMLQQIHNLQRPHGGIQRLTCNVCSWRH